ncbi:MAG: hypothetical protein JW832_04595 [Deltaproteobacteria bacterium]|nr:hypothetical protein [Deltaproteobacteria bacterium]
MLDAPVLFLIFNRPDLTGEVFETIRASQPARLFVAADGPRCDADMMLCERARGITGRVDWPCEVKTLFRDKNLGCKKAVSEAITWFFEHVEEGIILEDDTVPTQRFFLFCQELLAHYRHDERIMHISGENPLDHPVNQASYYFSKIEHCWGWATWRRAWRHFDVTMENFDAFVNEKILANIFCRDVQQKYWNDIFWRVKKGEIDTWDYIWTYTIFCNSGLCINPNINLVTNIGFGDSATHTKKDSPFSGRAVFDIAMPLTHPQFITHSGEALEEILKTRFFMQEQKDIDNPSFFRKLADKLRLRN